MSLIETSLIEPGSVSAAPRLSLSEPKDFLALLKPRVMSLVVLTAVTGMVVAPGTMNPVLAIVSILAIAVGAGASGALNMWYDADIDARMSRTKTRPVPSGRVEPDAALAFGLGLSIFSVMVLGLAANWFAAGFLAFTIFAADFLHVRRFAARIIVVVIIIIIIIIIIVLLHNFFQPSSRAGGSITGVDILGALPRTSFSFPFSLLKSPLLLLLLLLPLLIQPSP